MSELLHTYNEENGDDEELNKYVKGMIEAQTDGSEDDNDEPEMDEDMPEDEFDSETEEMDSPEEEMSQPDMKQEGKTFTKKQLKEEFGKAIKNKENDEEIRLDKKLNKSNVKKQNPFMPPKFN